MMACSSPATRGVQMDGFPSENGINSVKPQGSSPIANGGLHHRPTPPVGGPSFYEPIQRMPGTDRISEGVEPDEEGLGEEDKNMDFEMSPELQALNISKFLSSGSESGDDEQVSETVITDVYKDPLDLCMEAIEDLATGILRTGKLVINGEPGDMTKIQPALFNLQATDKNLSQLLPQLLQIPFFNCSKNAIPIIEDDLFEPSEDEALSEGLIRLGAPVDTAIYVLLRGFCAKGARQAEELINVCLSESYIPSLSLASVPMMPPIIKFQSSVKDGKRLSSGASMLTVEASKISTSSLSSGISSMSSNVSTSTSSLFSNGGKEDQQRAQGKVRHTESIIEEAEEEGHIGGERGLHKSAASPSNFSPHTNSPPRSPVSPFTGTRSHPALTKAFSGGSNKPTRKTSIVKPPSASSMTRSNSADSDISSVSEISHYAPSVDHWNTSIIDNNTIVAQYGELPYPIVWWNPSLKVDFRLSTSVGLLSGNVTGIDHEKPEVTIKVFNKSAKKIGFALRCSRQSTIFKSHVVYPNKGLETVEPYKSWEDTVEFYPGSADILEMFVIDLFFCTLDSKPSWNVIRKYAIMKPNKSSPKVKERKRISKRRLSILQIIGDGNQEHKEEVLKLVISHGLQCVVKGKLDEAEIIFSHALYLPDFQRVPLKAFVFICLSVIANKRKKQGHPMTLKNVMMAADASSKLVSVCEQGPGSVRMPRTLQLVKQLKKELNVQKIVKEAQSNKKKPTNISKYTPRLETKLVEEMVTPAGTVLAFKDTVIVIPANAVRDDSLVSVGTLDSAQLMSVLRTTGWDKIAQVGVAFHIEQSSSTLFRGAIHIETPVPADVKIGPSSVLRLMHSNYLRHWVDITNDVCSKIAVNSASGKLEIDTNLSGWLAVSVIELDTSLLSQMILKYISVEPSMFRFSTFGFLDAERSSMQVAIYVEPCKPNEELMHRDLSKPANFIPISFPLIIQAYPMETLRVEIQGGNFEPDTQNGEESLVFDMEVQQMHSDVLTKWVKLKSPLSSNQMISGKLKVSRRDGDLGWATVAHMNLSTVAAALPASSSESKE